MSILASFHATTGEILQVYGGPEDVLLTYTFPVGVDAVIVGDGVQAETHYIDPTTREPVAIPARPSADHQWDPATRTWRVFLEEALARRLNELRGVRDRKINGAFTWDGHDFDADQVSQTRLMGAYVSAVNTPAVFPKDWRLADNSWLTLSALDMVGVWTALQTHIATCFSVFAAHEAGLKAQTTVAGVQAYDISPGW